MSQDNIKMQILGVLDDLEEKNFNRFLFRLQNGSEEPCVRATEVENKSREDITKLLVSRCTGAGAVPRTITILRHIGCNEEAQELEQWNKARLEKLRPSLRYSSSGVVQLRPTAEAQALVSAHTPLEELTLQGQESHLDYPKDDLLALGSSILLLGQYKGQSFEWLLQNDVGYAVYMVATHQEERGKGSHDPIHMKNKDALAEYVSVFPEIVKEVHFYREGMACLGFGKYKNLTRKNLYNSKEKEKKSYVQWLRDTAQTYENGSRMKQYILHRDKHQSDISCLTKPWMTSCNKKYCKGKRPKSAATKRRHQSYRKRY